MAHFVIETYGYQVHLYCRDVHTYEMLFTAAQLSGGALHKDKGTNVTDGGDHPERLHLYMVGNEALSVDLDGTKYIGGLGATLAPEVLQSLREHLPDIDIPDSGHVNPAHFGVEMLQALIDF